MIPALLIIMGVSYFSIWVILYLWFRVKEDE